MGRHATQVLQMVKNLPHYTGYSDSCGIGTGGGWTYVLNKKGPIIWQEKWPQRTNELFKEGTLTINNLDLVGQVINWLEIECLPSNLSNNHTDLFCYNTLTVGCTSKLRSGSSVAEGHLLHSLGIHTHATQASHPIPISIAG